MSAPRRHSTGGAEGAGHERGSARWPVAGRHRTGGRAHRAAEFRRPERGADEMTHRRLKRSGLPPDKTLQTLVRGPLPRDVRRQIPALCRGDFVRRRQNVVALGPSGCGKTHLLCAIGHELIARGFTMLVASAHRLLERLLLAEQSRGLQTELRRLDAYDVVLIDDIGAVPHGPAQARLLFTLLARRYERRSVMIASCLPFPRWDRIFHDRVTATAAIDRVVHHATILQLTGSSYRGSPIAHGALPRASCYRRVGVASPDLLPSTAAPAKPEASR